MEPPRRHRACNACRSRKVRCNPGDQQRCRECEHLNLRCEYPAPAQRAKRNGRGAVIRGYQDARQNGDLAPLRPLQSAATEDSVTFVGSPTSPLNQHDEADFFHALLPDYETFVFPFFPIITAAEARNTIAAMPHDREAQAFMYALCASTIGLAHSITAADTDDATVMLHYLSKCTEALPGVLSFDDITVRRVVITQFMHNALAGLGRFEPAHHYLRQSISMVETLNLGDLTALEVLPLPDRARRQRLYHLIFIHERYFALFHHHLISMVPVDWLPEFDDTCGEIISRGFNQIICLFRHMDAEMINAWLSVTDETATVDPAWIQEKHRQLEAEPAGSADNIIGLWGMQQADLIITKHWMRLLLWQIALSKCLLSSSSDAPSMSLLFPVGVSTQLRAVIGQLSRQEISIHGSGIQQKLFEMTDIIAGVVLTLPNIDIAETRQRIDDFRFLYEFWRSLPRPNPTQLEILLEKEQKINALTILTP